MPTLSRTYKLLYKGKRDRDPISLLTWNSQWDVYLSPCSVIISCKKFHISTRLKRMNKEISLRMNKRFLTATTIHHYIGLISVLWSHITNYYNGRYIFAIILTTWSFWIGFLDRRQRGLIGLVLLVIIGWLVTQFPQKPLSGFFWFFAWS